MLNQLEMILTYLCIATFVVCVIMSIYTGIYRVWISMFKGEKKKITWKNM